MSEHAGIVKDECFLMALEFLREESFETRVSFRPNFSEIRKEGDKERIKAKISLINETSEDELVQLMEQGLQVSRDGVEILKEDVLYKKEFVCSGYSSSFDGFSVILDAGMTPELADAKTAREFFSLVQRLRKRAGLKTGDVVLVHVSRGSLAECVAKHYDIRFCELREKHRARDVFSCEDGDADVYLYRETE